MVVLAQGVAEAKAVLTAELDAPRRTLQTAMSGLLAQHVGLMLRAMRAQDRSTNFPAAGRAINLNSSKLAGGIRSRYGEDARPAGPRRLGGPLRGADRLRERRRRGPSASSGGRPARIARPSWPLSHYRNSLPQ